jgi:hypothetical protein
MEGGFFLIQYVDLEGAKGIEFIGYDEENGILRSHYFDDDGKVIEYTYKVSESDYIISIDMPGIKGRFDGKYSNNGNIISGNWHWKQDGEDMGVQGNTYKIKFKLNYYKYILTAYIYYTKKQKAAITAALTNGR